MFYGSIGHYGNAHNCSKYDYRNSINRKRIHNNDQNQYN